jgi:hypothetical protein
MFLVVTLTPIHNAGLNNSTIPAVASIEPLTDTNQCEILPRPTDGIVGAIIVSMRDAPLQRSPLKRLYAANAPSSTDKHRAQITLSAEKVSMYRVISLGKNIML